VSSAFLLRASAISFAGVSHPVAEFREKPRKTLSHQARARGTASADSDYDLLVVVRDDAPPCLRRSARAYEALWGLPTSGDILIWTHTAFVERLHLRASLPSTVEREGRLLYSPLFTRICTTACVDAGLR